ATLQVKAIKRRVALQNKLLQALAEQDGRVHGGGHSRKFCLTSCSEFPTFVNRLLSAPSGKSKNAKSREERLMEDTVIIERETAVHGAFPDTHAWQTRYTRARQDLIAALRQIPGSVEAFRQLAPHELYRIVWSPEMVTAIKEGSAAWKRGK